MARLAPNVQQALGQWWTLAMSAGYQGYTATDVISAASDLAGQSGQSISFNEGSAIATLFGYARRMSNAAEVVGNLQPQDYITPDAISTPPWARDDAEMQTLPIWHVYFDLTVADEDGNITTSRKVSTFRMTLPATMGELQDAVTSDAQAMSLKYRVSFVGADIREIQSV